jgi:D-alanine-D-alanine ligase
VHIDRPIPPFATQEAARRAVDRLLSHETINILTGGWGPERRENLSAGTGVRDTLDQAGAHAVLIDVRTPADLSAVGEGCTAAILAHTEELPTIPILEFGNVAHTGPSWATALATYDKAITHHLALAVGIRTPVLLKRDDARLSLRTGTTVVVKPRAGGSSVGLHHVLEERDLDAACRAATELGREELIQPYVGGDELTVAAYGSRVVSIIRIMHPGSVFDATAKIRLLATYQPVSQEFSASDLADVQHRIARLATAAGLTGFWRADFRVLQGEWWLLDVNALPYLGAPDAGMIHTILQECGLSHLDFLALCLTHRDDVGP